MPKWSDDPYVALRPEAAVRLDVVGDGSMYLGKASAGTVDAEAYWQIRKIITSVDGDVTVLWPEGNTQYIFAWADRAGLSYV